MKVILLLGLCLHLIYVSEGKIFRRCEIVKIANEQLDGYAGASAADWTCLMEHESDYNSALIQDNQAQSRDYGIFQINSKYWCDDGRIDTANRCNIKCWSKYNGKSLSHINA
uniref:Lysozyme n=1 Tax=Pyxicephalus adspersus TaxID=30357 RepID=A0AAV3ASF0_PYXAD|nr:TPA: hypothetical protein GDO54_009972 [Pyxicephalus adspersus]